ncbi:MAG: hypothetical protein PHV74_02360 [Dehalococcoidia bacterium]|nr:hypothetical protein [Dehalococcoidia bacterium]
MNNLRKSVMVVMALLLSALFMASCSGDSTDADRYSGDGWYDIGSVSFRIPEDRSDNLPPPGGVWDKFMNSHNGQGLVSVTDSTKSAELTIAVLRLPANGDVDFNAPSLDTYVESAAEILMSIHNYLYSDARVKTELSGHLACEYTYHGSNSGLDFEGRFLAVAGNDDLVILTYVAPTERWDYFGPIYDATKSHICFSTKKNADGTWEPCFVQYL